MPDGKVLYSRMEKLGQAAGFMLSASVNILKPNGPV
jgi:hypothetical protein